MRILRRPAAIFRSLRSPSWVAINERFFEYYDQIYNGVQVRVRPPAFFELRTFFSGQDFNRVNVDPGPFVRATFQLRF